MKKYKLSLLGHEIFIKTNVEETRIKEAEKLILNRFKKINNRLKKLTNEEILILVALSLADDFIQIDKRLKKIEEKLVTLLYKIDDGGAKLI